MMTENKTPPTDTPHSLGDLIVPSYVPSGPNIKLRVLRWATIGVCTVFVLALGIGFWGNARWTRGIATRVQALEAATPKTGSQRYDDAELTSLPPPVRRYLSQALHMYQPIVRGVYLEQTGLMNRSTTVAQWEPFSARQRVATKRPGFVWDAALTPWPGVTLRVVDAYVGGVGSLQPSLFGLIDVGGIQGTGDIARGELIRYFAESVWYPTALLPSQGVQWKAVDDHTAQATLTDGPITVTLTFAFNAEGLVERISSTERSALVDGKTVPMPWEVRLSSYQMRSGMLVPLEAEVAWLTPSGRMPYWRGTVETLDYDMPR